MTYTVRKPIKTILNKQSNFSALNKMFKNYLKYMKYKLIEMLSL